MHRDPAVADPLLIDVQPARPQWLAAGLAIYAACSLVSMAVMSIGIAFVLLGLAIGFGSPRALYRAFDAAWRRSAVRLYLFVTLALTLACLLSLVAARLAPLGFGGKLIEVSIAKDMAKAWYLFWPLPLFVGLGALGSRHRSWVIRSWLGAFAVLSAIGIAQHFTGWPRPQRIPGLDWNYHATLFLGHHLSVASVFVFPFFAALDLLGSRDRAKGFGLSRAFLAIAVAAGAACLFFGYSRALWVALPLGVLAWALWTLPRAWGSVAAVMLSLAAYAIYQHPQIRYRVNDGLGVGPRQELWKANLEFFKLRPLTGAGWHHNLELSGWYLIEKNPGSKDIFSGHAHNNAIEMLGGMGLFGLISWIAWCLAVLSILWPAARDPSRSGFAKGLVCAWLVFQLNGLTQVNFWESKVMHQMAWAVAWSLVWAAARPGGISGSAAARGARA